MLTGEGDLYDDFENYDEYGGDTIISSNYTSKSIIIIDGTFVEKHLEI